MLGVAIGVAGGAWLGTLIIGLYNHFFRFPVLLFQRAGRRRSSAPTALTLAGRRGWARSARCAGRSASRRPRRCGRSRRPATGASVLETPFVARRLGTAGRMVLRNLTRHPLRAAASMVGIAFAVAILMIGFVFIDAIDRLIATQFSVAERQDVTVTLRRAAQRAAPHALARAAGRDRGRAAADASPCASAPAIASATSRVTGVPDDARASSASSIATGGRSDCRRAGWCCRACSRDVLGVAPGDTVTVEVLEGQRPVARRAGGRAGRRHLGAVGLHGRGRAAPADARGRRRTGALLLVDAPTRSGLSAGAQADAGRGRRRRSSAPWSRAFAT